MALSGTISNKWKGYTYQISWSASQNIAGNYSTVTCTHYLVCDSTWSLYIGARTITCTVNSASKTCSTPSINTNGGSTICLGTTTHTVNHASSGVGSFSLSSTFPIQATIQGVYQESISTSGSATLNTIPRASTMSVPEFTMGTAGTMIISKASSDFTHTITYVFGNKSGTIANKTSSASVSWTPDLNELASQIPNDTRGYGSLTLITYSGSTELGKNSYTFYCNIPSDVGPTIQSFTVSPIKINNNSILVQNKNQISIRVSGCTAGTGSSIKSYTYSGPGLSTTLSSPNIVIGPISSTGNLTYTVKATDLRGRTASKSASITCYEYNNPNFSKFEISRDNDNNIKCNYNISYSSVNNTNDIIVKFYYKKGSGNWIESSDQLSDSEQTGYVVLSDADDTIYSVYATVTDSYGASVTSNTKTTFGSTKLINIPASGNGISFGRKTTISSASEDGKFEVGWNATFDKDIDVGGTIKISGTDLINIIYPVGSIYISANNISPQTFFGGTWESFGEGKTLVGVDDSQTEFNEVLKTGGEKTHTLTVNEMPSHDGHMYDNFNDSGWADRGGDTNSYFLNSETATQYGYGKYENRPWKVVSGNEFVMQGYSKGGSQAHNNLQPYITVYMWRRTS